MQVSLIAARILIKNYNTCLDKAANLLSNKTCGPVAVDSLQLTHKMSKNNHCLSEVSLRKEVLFVRWDSQNSREKMKLVSQPTGSDMCAVKQAALLTQQVWPFESVLLHSILLHGFCRISFNLLFCSGTCRMT